MRHVRPESVHVNTTRLDSLSTTTEKGGCWYSVLMRNCVALAEGGLIINDITNHVCFDGNMTRTEIGAVAIPGWAWSGLA